MPLPWTPARRGKTSPPSKNQPPSKGQPPDPEPEEQRRARLADQIRMLRERELLRARTSVAPPTA